MHLSSREKRTFSGKNDLPTTFLWKSIWRDQNLLLIVDDDEEHNDNNDYDDNDDDDSDDNNDYDDNNDSDDDNNDSDYNDNYYGPNNDLNTKTKMTAVTSWTEKILTWPNSIEIVLPEVFGFLQTIEENIIKG